MTATSVLAFADSQEKVQELEDFLLTLPQIDVDVQHNFSGKMYARTIVMPADLIVTGRVYLCDHLDIMTCGDITINNSGKLQRIVGSHIFERQAGKKQAAYTHAVTKWTTICNCADMPDGMDPEDYYMDELTSAVSAKVVDLLQEPDRQRGGVGS